MKEVDEDNGSSAAFATYAFSDGPFRIADGLTKREFFAALAMQNLQNVLLRKSGEEKLKKHVEWLQVDDERAIAYLAVKQADALLDALNRHDLHYKDEDG